MSFLFPQFLYGLIAIAIPIIVHLFNFRRTKKVYFSNNRFLQDIKESNSSRLRLKHLLVLLSRILFIVFLVLAFAQPYISSDNKTVPGNHVKVYVDNSYSMSNQTADDIPAIDQALVFAESIVSLYPKSTSFQLFTNEFNVRSESAMTYESFSDALTEVSLSPITRNFQEIIGRMERSGAAMGDENVDYYLISDFQKSTFSGDMTALDTLNSYAAVPVSFLDTSNIFLDSIYLSNPFLLKGISNELLVSLRNTGNEAAEDVIVKLTLSDRQVASTAVSIDAQSTAKVTFELTGNLQDENKGVLSFEDFPVSFDNEYYFTLNTTEKINIIELYQDAIAPAILSKVYANEQLFEFTSFNIDNFDYNLLNAVDLLVLNEIQNVNDAILPLIRDYVSGGGTLVIIFDDNPDLDDYRALGLPENFKAVQQSGISQTSLAQPDYNNPFFQDIFDASDERIEMPNASNTVTWQSEGLSILSYNNGVPFLSSSANENVFYIGAPLRDSYTNFHKQALFVPVMYRLAALSLTKGERLYYEISDAQLQLKRDNLEPTDILKLQRRDEEIIPSQYLIDNTVFLEVPKFTLGPGFYNLVNNDSLLRSIAFNFNKEESYLQQLSQTELAALFGNNVKIYSNADAGELKDELEEVFTGKALWKYCLGLALFFLFLEIAFIRLL